MEAVGTELHSDYLPKAKQLSGKKNFFRPVS